MRPGWWQAQALARLGNWERNLQSGEALWSDELYRIFGVKPEEFTPTLEAVLRRVHPEDVARVRQCLNDALAGLRPYNTVFRIIRPDGSVRYIHSQAEVLFDKDGQPLRMLGVAQDITERRMAEMRLRDSEERFRAIFESAALGMALTDLEGRFLTVNAVLLQMLGYQREELQGRTFLDITHPEDRAESWKSFQDLKVGKREHYQMEKRYLRQDGSRFLGAG